MSRRSQPASSPPSEGLLSIGALSGATGIPVDTIRTWERRYGFPVAERKPSGHRVYPLSTVPRLRQIAQAIARGHRAAEVVTASASAVDALLASIPASGRDAAASQPASRAAPATGDSGYLLDLLRSFDANQLRQSFASDWARMGPLDFLERRAAPFLTAVGDGWAAGSLDVRHEHFGSSVLGDFLRTVRLPFDDRASGPIAALATLEGELHGLGLQMAALLFAVAGWRALVMGVDTPASQVIALAQEASLGAVAISCVQPRNSRMTALLRGMRRRLPAHVEMVVGGAGAPPVTAGIDVLPDLSALERWLAARRAA